MKKLLITALLGLSLISCSQNKNFVRQGDVFDYQEKYAFHKFENMSMEKDGGLVIGAIYDLNENEKMDHVAFYDLTRKDSIINYAPAVIKMKKEISLEEWMTKMSKKNIDYFLFDNDNNGTLEKKTKAKK